MVYHMYNLTNFTSGNATLLQLAQASNRIVDGWLGLTIIVILVIVSALVLSLKGYKGSAILAGVSFASMIISIMFYAIDFISGMVLVASIILAAFGMLFLFIFKE